MSSLTSGNRYAAALIVVSCTSTYLATSIITVFLLLRRWSNKVQSLNRGQKVTLAYTVVMCFITLIWTGCTVYDIGLSLVELPKPRPGSVVFWQRENILQNVLGTLIFVGSDALMVYRLYAMYSGNLMIIILSIFIYFSFITVAILINLPLAPSNSIHYLAMAFFSLSAGLNALVCALIAAKLLHFRRFTGMYVSIVAVIVESAVLYATCSVVFVIFVQVRSPTGFWFGAFVNCSAFLNQGWIILRAVMGYSTTHSGTTKFTQGASEQRWTRFSSDLRSDTV